MGQWVWYGLHVLILQRGPMLFQNLENFRKGRGLAVSDTNHSPLEFLPLGCRKRHSPLHVALFLKKNWGSNQHCLHQPPITAPSFYPQEDLRQFYYLRSPAAVTSFSRPVLLPLMTTEIPGERYDLQISIRRTFLAPSLSEVNVC